MGKRTGTVTIVALALTLVGCAAAAPQDAFVSAVEGEAPGVLDRGDRDQLIELGSTICGAIEDGTSAYDLADRFTELGWSIGESGSVVVQAVTHLCPEHVDALG